MAFAVPRTHLSSFPPSARIWNTSLAPPERGLSLRLPPAHPRLEGEKGQWLNTDLGLSRLGLCPSETLNMLPNRSLPWVPHLQRGCPNRTCFIGSFARLSGLTHKTRCLACSKHFVCSDWCCYC